MTYSQIKRAAKLHVCRRLDKDREEYLERPWPEIYTESLTAFAWLILSRQWTDVKEEQPAANAQCLVFWVTDTEDGEAERHTALATYNGKHYLDSHTGEKLKPLMWMPIPMAVETPSVMRKTTKKKWL